MHCGKKWFQIVCVYGAYPSCTSGNDKYEDLKANPSINWENAVWYQHAATLPFLFWNTLLNQWISMFLFLWKEVALLFGKKYTTTTKSRVPAKKNRENKKHQGLLHGPPPKSLEICVAVFIGLSKVLWILGVVCKFNQIDWDILGFIWFFQISKTLVKLLCKSALGSAVKPFKRSP